MINYVPQETDTPIVIDVVSAWQPLAKYIKDILVRFNIPTAKALEFGVERGFSTVVLANYFKKVIGVDKWDWEIPDGVSRNYHIVVDELKEFKNIKLIQAPYEEFIIDYNERFDLIHVDIGYDTHTYGPTYTCGEWAVQHAKCVLFHDTQSFPEVAKACEELAEKYGFYFYNISEEVGPAGVVCGLGILIKKI
jgi:hypothetical protein